MTSGVAQHMNRQTFGHALGKGQLSRQAIRCLDFGIHGRTRDYPEKFESLKASNRHVFRFSRLRWRQKKKSIEPATQAVTDRIASVEQVLFRHRIPTALIDCAFEKTLGRFPEQLQARLSWLRKHAAIGLRYPQHIIRYQLPPLSEKVSSQGRLSCSAAPQQANASAVKLNNSCVERLLTLKHKRGRYGEICDVGAESRRISVFVNAVANIPAGRIDPQQQPVLPLGLDIARREDADNCPLVSNLLDNGIVRVSRWSSYRFMEPEVQNAVRIASRQRQRNIRRECHPEQRIEVVQIEAPEKMPSVRRPNERTRFDASAAQ